VSNWTGIFSITTPGTTLTGATSTTATNTAASWPTGATSLANFYMRTLGGTGAGQFLKIASNTATVITFASAPTVALAAGTTYEIVHQFQDQDHVTGALVFYTNIINEIQPSATIYVDGYYSVTYQNTGTATPAIRCALTESTLSTVCFNNRTVVGTNASWGSIQFPTPLSVAPAFSFVRVMDCNYPILLGPPNSTIYTYPGITKIWAESIGGYFCYFSGAQRGNVVVNGIYCRNSTYGNLYFTTTTNTFSCRYDTCWVNGLGRGFPAWSTPGPALEWVTNTVFINSASSGLVDTASSQEFRLSRCFISGPGLNGQFFPLGQSSTADAGKHTALANVSNLGAIVSSSGGAGSTGTTLSANNDVASHIGSNIKAMSTPAGAGTTITSDNDFFAGTATAPLQNVDTSAATLSTATPAQYGTLTTARTHPRSTPNYPLALTNVVVGTPTTTSCTITFDCANGAAASQSSTVNVTSNAGQPVLSVASTNGIQVGEMIEIAYGTARYEIGRVASFVANTSVTLESNLAFTHTSAQADVVALYLRHPALPFARLGTASGVYDTTTPLPDPNDWGLYWTGIKTLLYGETYAFRCTGHSITFNHLQPGTTYYVRPGAYSSLGDEMDPGAEYTFTTASVVAATTTAYASMA
jgi:hypothetical protein